MSPPPDTAPLSAASAGAVASRNDMIAPGSRLKFASALLELTKPSVTLLVMVTMVSGALVAPSVVGLPKLLLALFATACVVGAANAFNMCIERDADALMTRTRKRPLPTGRLSHEVALGFGALLAVVGLTLLAVSINSLTALLGWIALCSYVLAYTPLKRVTPWALHVGAVPGAMPPLIGWASVTGTLSRDAFFLFAILFVWQLPHFLAIATFRAPEYLRAGFRVLPNEKGVRATQSEAIAYCVLLLLVAIAPTLLGAAGLLYGAVALFSSLVFLGCALHGRRSRSPEAWARRLFFASLPYVVIVFGAFVVAR